VRCSLVCIVKDLASTCNCTEAPALDLMFTTPLCFQRHVSVGVCSNACMQVGGGQRDSQCMHVAALT
jgi:hypothetical protein